MSHASATSEIRFYNYIGLFSIAIIVLGIGGWAAWASIHGAVIASSTVVVEKHLKKIQHADGGIVSRIFVEDGQKVRAGEVLLTLDETETKAHLSIITTQLTELQSRQARLEAERDGEDAISFPPELLTRQKETQVRKVLSGQKNLLEARRSANNSKKEQLKQRIEQLNDEITGLVAQQKSKEKQTKLIRRELVSLRVLKDKNLVPLNRLLALEREEARLEGQRGEHISAIARAKGQIGEIKIRIVQIDQDARTEVLTELREVQTKVAELQERLIAASERLKRLQVRSPKSGVVHRLNIHTIGGVIKPGEPIMLIVPEQEKLVLEAQVNPQNIDQIKTGQKAVVRFSAFDQRTTPELNGVVFHISADLTQTTEQLPPHYIVKIKLPKKELARFGDRQLKPGMPAEAFIQTGARTALSYLTKPLTDQIMRTFRER